jgi:bifunctional DNA-binding transcriptional regulator/antitoxin component of YhaV-PrlF toxin-antitoxin module
METSSRSSKPLKVELIPVGDEKGFIIPDDMLARLGVMQGDEVMFVETQEGVALRRYVSPSRSARE